MASVPFISIEKEKYKGGEILINFSLWKNNSVRPLMETEERGQFLSQKHSPSLS